MGVNYNPKIATDGLVLCLDASSSRSYPGVGITMFDRSNRGHASTLYNSPTFDSEKGGRIIFDGSNDHLIIPININSAQKMTFIMTFKYLGSWESSFGLLNSGSGPSLRRAFRFMVSGTNQISWHIGHLGPVLNEFIESNKIYQVAITWDLSTYKSYKNGVLTNLATDTSWYWADYNTRIVVGAASSYSNFGLYNLFYYKDKCLTADEILQNYNATRGRFGI